MRYLLAIAAGGAVGALSRYALSGWVQRLTGSDFPLGTLFVNVLGCFLIGWLAHVGQTTDLIPPAWNAAARIGFLGALTTFSTFGFETLQLLQDDAWTLALLNVAGSMLLGLIAVWGGLVVGRLMVGP